METIGIVLLPDEDTETLLRALSQLALLDFGSSIMLDTGSAGPRPHLSLFHMQVEADRLQAVYDAVDALPLPARISGHCYRRHLVGGNWLFLQAERTALVEIQMPVVEAVAPLRSGNVEITWKMSEAQAAMHARYGYPNIGAAWDTHFTYGYVSDSSRVPQALRNGIDVAQPWSARDIAVVRVGNHGTAGEILHMRHPARL